MFNKKLFTTLQKELEKSDEQREKVIKKSRDILKASKKAIYSVHRGNLKQASEFLKKAKDGISKVKKFAGSNTAILTTGIFPDAQEEFVEASLYYAYDKGTKFPSHTDLKVPTDQYLGGLCDLVGELVRAAINAAIRGDYKKTKKIKEFVNKVYDELMMFNFRNSPLRRKFDSIKYGLEKLEDLTLDLQLRGKTK